MTGVIRQITSLVLIKKFLIDWFKISYLGEADTVIKLGTKSRFDDMGLRIRDSVLELFSLVLMNLGQCRIFHSQLSHLLGNFDDLENFKKLKLTKVHSLTPHPAITNGIKNNYR